MNLQWRDFLLVVTLVAAATPALGQTAMPAVGAASTGTPSAAPIPDFSGIWGHPSLGFEPPLSGPGPVLNKSRLPTGESDFDKLVGDYTNPILKPEAAEVVKKQGEISLSGVAFPDPGSQCWPHGVPYIFWQFEMQMLQEPNKITILYFEGHQVRHVRMNEPHRVPVTPSWYGDSVGHYEGDTLVIDTVGVKIGPFPMVDFYGTPYSQALHVVERYRLLDFDVGKEGLERDVRENRRPPGGADAGSAPDYSYRGKLLQLQFTVEDEGVFTMPWTATITYRRGREAWREVVCAENTRELAIAGRAAAVPRADKPDF
jgi:hypothetical protein